MSSSVTMIKVHANMFLHITFRQRGWSNPSHVPVEEPEITALMLLEMLQIPLKDVGIIFVNGKPFPPAAAILHPGDRVALFSPGAPVVFEDVGVAARLRRLVDHADDHALVS
jgi:hypothetical protein